MSQLPSSDAFTRELLPKFSFDLPKLQLGAAMLEKKAVADVPVQIPLKMFNRHGLITGATGTGKTVTLQVIAEQLSLAGVPSLLMDMKGDLSGIATPSSGHPKIDERMKAINLPFQPEQIPVEFLTLSKSLGLRLRATVSEFGPQLFSKMLGLNDTQTGIATVVFQYCDDNGLALVNLDDFRTALNYIRTEAKEEVEARYGHLSGSSAGTILRKMLELEQQGGDSFFGEPSFDVMDLCRTVHDRGVVSVLSLKDIQDKPRLFSTFMLSLLAEVYRLFPEVGDLDKPKLVIFIDEAHLIFDKATDELIEQLESIIKLIRSKAVGVYFCTQNPTDIPDSILSQLGLKVQHSLRAFTAKDRQAIRLVARNFPDSKYYAIESLLTEMGIGEALVCGLDPKGRPLPAVHTLLRAPVTRLGPLTDKERQTVLSTSTVAAKYAATLDAESAHEILNRKIAASRDLEARRLVIDERDQKAAQAPVRTRTRSQKGFLEQVLASSAARQVGRTLAREMTRGLLGALGSKRR